MTDRATRVALYLRVSTGEQNVEMQRRELTEAAGRRGWIIVQEYADEGLSGAKGRDQRPAFDRLCRDMVRRKFDLVAAWSVDRLGRSLLDLVGFLQEMHAAGVGLYLDRQGVDTSTPGGRAMFQMMGVFAEFERALIVERTRAGLARARKSGTRSGRAIGRPSATPEQIARVRAALQAGAGINKAARLAGCGNQLAARVAADMRANIG
jgi:DNA invertase Pin-like site-specific DNA recombinase